MRKHHLKLIIILIFSLIQLIFAGNKPSTKKLKNELLERVDKKSQLLIKVSDSLWDYAEIALLEYKSSKLLVGILEKEGFDVEREVAGIPTAFVASYGSGKPIIGILAEYDALPGLSQDNTTFRKARIEGEAGHGCGHNLFGAGSLGAALALKEVFEAHKIPGTIKLYGCPAEEDIGGKLYMARDGLFDDLDACIAWHPSYETKVDVRGSQAIDDLEIEFSGKTSHAAFDPWKGASALDAVEMTTFGINLLREHVKPTVRIHYVITQGGKVPNIVPEHAKLWLWARDSTRQGVKDVVKRIEEIVKGAAIATGTFSKINYKGSYHEMLVNLTGSKVMQKNLEMVGSIAYLDEEAAFAKRIQKETNIEQKGMVCEVNKLEDHTKDPEGGSTDVAEVSWITPTLHLSTSCAPYGIPWHSWAVVSSSKHSIGYKGMFLAAKVTATTALDLFLDNEILIKMKKEFKDKLKGYTYKSGIPPDQKSPLRVKNYP
ncbi:MAG: amidohydrolase [Candidatus Aminicenantes bacterium]|nr:MAG: amidohydrolase [Candidatus Aminicenantes bacterium]